MTGNDVDSLLSFAIICNIYLAVPQTPIIETMKTAPGKGFLTAHTIQCHIDELL